MKNENQNILLLGLGVVLAYSLLRNSSAGSGSHGSSSNLGAGCELPRGIRNNNPGNIKVGPSQWQGKVPLSQNTDTDCSTGRIVQTFEQFISYEYGIRAMVKLIQNYMNNQGLRTIRQIITRWAPNTENDSNAYISYLEDRTGIDRNAPLNPTRETLRILTQAIARVENGVEAITDQEFYAVWEEFFGGGVTGTTRQLSTNIPEPSTRANKKRMVLVQEGGRQEIVHYGDPDYRHNYSPQTTPGTPALPTSFPSVD